MSLRGTAAGADRAPTAELPTPTTAARVGHLLCALVLGAVVLVGYLPAARVLGLERGSLGIEGAWIGGHAKRITAVTPGGPADRAGLRAGDVLQLDPERDADWVLVGYRQMPEGFRATLPVRRADGTTVIVELAPDRVTYLPTLNDRAALLARLAGLTVMTGTYADVFQKVDGAWKFARRSFYFDQPEMSR